MSKRVENLTSKLSLSELKDEVKRREELEKLRPKGYKGTFLGFVEKNNSKSFFNNLSIKVRDAIGPVLPQDIGKAIFQRENGSVCVESQEQFEKRIAAAKN